MEDIYWNVKNNDQNTALDLLEQASNEDPEWVCTQNLHLKLN